MLNHHQHVGVEEIYILSFFMAFYVDIFLNELLS